MPQFIVYLKRSMQRVCSMQHSIMIEAATKQDAIEGALDRCPIQGFFVVDKVEKVDDTKLPEEPAEEKQ